MRINRFLASAGLGSRRGVETLIKEGRVSVNGQVISDLSTDIGPKDSVKVDNKLIRQQGHLYVLLNKPRGYLCTASDEKDRRTIYDLLPKSWPKLAHVGRLDKESEGLLILTNDGDLALRLTHPRYKVEKAYDVALDRPYDHLHTEKLLRGFMTQEGRAKMESVEETGSRTLHVTLRQGLKRQIRLMMYELGYEVDRLRRVRIGPITDHNLPTGEWRLLGKREVEMLMSGEERPPEEKPRRAKMKFEPRERPAKKQEFRGEKPARRAGKASAGTEKGPREGREGREGGQPRAGRPSQKAFRSERPQSRRRAR